MPDQQLQELKETIKTKIVALKKIVYEPTIQ